MNISHHLEKMKLELLKISSIPQVTTLGHNNSTLPSHKSGQLLYLLHTEIKSYLVHTLNINHIQRLIFTFSVNLSISGHIIYICLSFC